MAQPVETNVAPESHKRTSRSHRLSRRAKYLTEENALLDALARDLLRLLQRATAPRISESERVSLRQNAETIKASFCPEEATARSTTPSMKDKR